MMKVWASAAATRIVVARPPDGRRPPGEVPARSATNAAT